MNPWDIVSWIGAISVAILIIVVTASVVIGVAQNRRAPRKTTDQFDTIIESAGLKR